MALPVRAGVVCSGMLRWCLGPRCHTVSRARLVTGKWCRRERRAMYNVPPYVRAVPYVCTSATRHRNMCTALQVSKIDALGSTPSVRAAGPQRHIPYARLSRKSWPTPPTTAATLRAQRLYNDIVARRTIYTFTSHARCQLCTYALARWLRGCHGTPEKVVAS